MSDTDDALRTKLLAVREYLRTRQRDLKVDAILVRGKIEELGEAIAALDDLLEENPRRSRPRKSTVINLPPQHTEPEREDSIA